MYKNINRYKKKKFKKKKDYCFIHSLINIPLFSMIISYDFMLMNFHLFLFSIEFNISSFIFKFYF